MFEKKETEQESDDLALQEGLVQRKNVASAELQENSTDQVDVSGIRQNGLEDYYSVTVKGPPFIKNRLKEFLSKTPVEPNNLKIVLPVGAVSSPLQVVFTPEQVPMSSGKEDAGFFGEINFDEDNNLSLELHDSGRSDTGSKRNETPDDDLFKPIGSRVPSFFHR
jgi:hypothetical protein